MNIDEQPRRASWVLGLAMLAGPIAVASAQGPGADEDPIGSHADAADLSAEVWRILSEPGESEGEPVHAKRLAALGPSAIPAIVASLRGECEPPAELAPGPELLQAWDRALADSLMLFESRHVVEHLRVRCAAQEDPAFDLFAAELLGRLPHESAFDALLELAQGLDPLARRGRQTERVFTGALASQLALGGERLRTLQSFGRRADTATLTFIAPCLSACEARQLALLTRWLGRDAELDTALLGCLDASLREAHGQVDVVLLQAVRGSLASLDPRVQRSAATVAGHVRDFDAVDPLLGLLESPDARVRAAVRWSLGELAGRDLGASELDWRAWYQGELEWWDARSAELFSALAGEQSAAMHEALIELAEHPLFRHKAAVGMGPLLVRDDPVLATTTCGILLRLESDRALPWLLDALAMPDDGRRPTVHSALKRLTGLDLPAESRTWRAALES